MSDTPPPNRWAYATLILSAAVALGGPGCSTFRPAANRGQDLLENPGWPLWARIPAGLGAAVGTLAAFPAAVILLPTLPFDSAVVETSQGYGSGRERGDVQIPLVQASFEYSGGVGAAVVGSPFKMLAAAVGEPPGPPPGTLEEEPEPLPGTPDPALDFAVRVP